MALGLAMGTLLTGLVLPFVVGDREQRAATVATEGVAVGDVAHGTGAAVRTAQDPQGSPAADAATVDGGESPSADGPSAAPVAGGAPSASAPGARTTAEPGRSATVAQDGVTDTTVKVGFLLLDVGQLSRFGVSAPVVDPELLRGAYQAFVDDLNDRGGFHGRRLEASYRTFEITSADSQRAACLGLTEDEKVFIVIGEFPDRSANLCVTQEHRTLFLTPALAGIADDVFEASGGLMFSLYPKGSRQMVDLAKDLHRMEALRGKKIGIVNQRSNDPSGAMGDVLQRTLADLGQSVVHRVDFSDDNGEAASQVPVQVQQMRTKGADVVLLLANTIVNTQFTQAADAQGWRPTYYMTDWNYMNTDTAAQNLPPSMDGTVGLTYGRAYEWRAAMPESPVSRSCVDIYRRKTGRSTTRQETSYQSVTFACAHAGQLAAGLGGAGPALTRESFSHALQSAGAIPQAAAWWGPGDYRRGKFDYVNALRTQTWVASCRCWHPKGPFRQP